MMRRGIIIRIATITGARRLRGIGATINGMRTPDRASRWCRANRSPLAVYEVPCFFRQRALAALDEAGVPRRIAFTSRSLHGLWAAVEAGLGVTLRTAVGLPATLRVLDGLRALADPALPICLHDGGRELASTPTSLRSAIFETLGGEAACVTIPDLSC
jgi:DNA-binding transcriptional LysR family regulator